jgi:hypothetical protein
LAGAAESVGDGAGDGEPVGDVESDGGSRNGDAGEDEGPASGGDGWPGVTVQVKLAEPVAPDEEVAVTVTR